MTDKEEKYGKFKLDSIDISVFTNDELYRLLKLTEGSIDVLEDGDKDLLRRLQNQIETKKEDYYTEKEKSRTTDLIKGSNIDKLKLSIIENQRKDVLISNLLKFKNKEKYIKENQLYINREFLDKLTEFFKLDNGGLKNKSLEHIRSYKDVSDLFINKIDKKIIDDYEKGVIVDEKFMFFLEIREYMK